MCWRLAQASPQRSVPDRAQPCSQLCSALAGAAAVIHGHWQSAVGFKAHFCLQLSSNTLSMGRMCSGLLQYRQIRGHTCVRKERDVLKSPASPTSPVCFHMLDWRESHPTAAGIELHLLCRTSALVFESQITPIQPSPSFRTRNLQLGEPVSIK